MKNVKLFTFLWINAFPPIHLAKVDNIHTYEFGNLLKLTHLLALFHFIKKVFSFLFLLINLISYFFFFFMARYWINTTKNLSKLLKKASKSVQIEN